MAVGIFINGMGRMGRVITRALVDGVDYQGNQLFSNSLYIAGFNDVHNVDNVGYLLQFDTTYGIWREQVEAIEDTSGGYDNIVISGKEYKLGHASSVDDLLNFYDAIEQSGEKIDVFLDCSGNMTAADLQAIHQGCGAKLVIACYPVLNNSSASADFAPYVVFGVNHTIIGDYQGNNQVICMASPDVQIISNIINALGQSDIERFIAYSSRSNSNVQFVEDSYNKKNPPLGKAASYNITPSTSSNAKSMWYIMPALNAKCTIVESRALTLTGGVVNICVKTTFPNITLTEIDEALNANLPSDIKMNDIYKIAVKSLASSDALYQPYAGIILSDLTNLVFDGEMFTITAIYDNEYGQAIQTLREIDYYMNDN